MTSNVRKFAILSYLSLLIGVVQAFMMFHEAVAQAAKVGGAWFVVTVQIAVFSILAILYAAAALGRQNWARWAVLVIFVLGLPFVVLSYPSLFGHAPVQGVVSVIQTIMQAAGLYYVFTGNAKEWFQKSAAT